MWIWLTIITPCHWHVCKTDLCDLALKIPCWQHMQICLKFSFSWSITTNVEFYYELTPAKAKLISCLANIWKVKKILFPGSFSVLSTDFVTSCLSTEITVDKILNRFLSTVWNIIVFLIQGAYSCKTPPAIETQSNERCYVVANIITCFCKIGSNHISFYSHPSQLPYYFKAVKIIISILRKATAEIYWASSPNITQQILSVLKFSYFKDDMHPTGRFF